MLCSEKIDGAENSIDQETRERLIFKILMGLEEEIALLSNILTQFNDINQVGEIGDKNNKGTIATSLIFLK